MLKKIVFLLCLISSVTFFSGCSVHNSSRTDKMLDVTKVEKYVTPGQTTLSEVRELIGTPGLSGRTIDGKDFVGFAITGDETAGEIAGDFAKSVLTFGIADDHNTKYVQKNIYFVLDDNKVVQDIKYNGYAYISHMGTFSAVIYAERELNDAELRDTTNYSQDYIIDSWKRYVVETKPADVKAIADKDGVAIEKLDYDDVEYPHTGIPGHLQRGAFKLFGEYTNEEVNITGGVLPNDGVKKAVLGL